MVESSPNSFCKHRDRLVRRNRDVLILQKSQNSILFRQNSLTNMWCWAQVPHMHGTACVEGMNTHTGMSLHKWNAEWEPRAEGEKGIYISHLQRKVHKVEPIVVVNREFAWISARELIFVAWSKMSCSSNLSSEVPHISTFRGWRCGHIKLMDMHYVMNTPIQGEKEIDNSLQGKSSEILFAAMVKIKKKKEERKR